MEDPRSGMRKWWDPGSGIKTAPICINYIPVNFFFLSSLIGRSQALMTHIDEFIQNLFFMAADGDPEVRDPSLKKISFD
jgi:hypothetical protein